MKKYDFQCSVGAFRESSVQINPIINGFQKQYPLFVPPIPWAWDPRLNCYLDLYHQSFLADPRLVLAHQQQPSPQRSE